MKFYLPFFILLIIALIFPLQDPDLFMYLSLGKLFFENGSFPTQDPFMFTYKSWHVYHEWLGYIVFYLSYLIGGYAGVTALKVFLWGTLFGVITRFSKLSRSQETISLALLMLTAFIYMHRFVERTSLFSDLFLIFLLAAFLQNKLYEKRWQIAVPILFLLWVNLHPAFISGLILLGMYIVLQGKSATKQMWMSVTASLLVCLLNPLGFEGLIYPLKTVLKPEWALYKTLNYEWMPTFGSRFIKAAETKALFLLISFSAALTTLTVIKSFKKNLFLLGASTMFFYLAISASRFMGLGAAAFAIIAIYSWGQLQLRLPEKINRRMTYALSTLCLLLAGVVLVDGYTPSSGKRTFGIGPDPQNLPVHAATFINEQLPQGRIFNEYSWGSYLAWALGPQSRLFIHGHIDDPRIMAYDYHNMNRDKSLFDDTVKRHDIQYILLDKRELNVQPPPPILNFMTGWFVVYQDEISLILKRP